MSIASGQPPYSRHRPSKQQSHLREVEFVKTAVTPYESKTHHAHLIKITGASVDISEKSNARPEPPKSGEKVEALDSKTPESKTSTPEALKPDALEERYCILLPMPVGDETRLSPGDRIKVLLDLRTADWNTGAWTGFVSDPVQNIRYDFVAAYISRPWSKDTEKYTDLTTLTAIDSAKMDCRQQILETLANDKGVMVKVKLASSDKPYKRVMNSIREMDIMFKDAKHERTGEAFETMELVLCNRLDLIQDKDVFGPIRDKCPKPESEMLLNGVQKIAVESALSCAPAVMPTVMAVPVQERPISPKNWARFLFVIRQLIGHGERCMLASSPQMTIVPTRRLKLLPWPSTNSKRLATSNQTCCILYGITRILLNRGLF